jgi:hypothetical protein
VTDEIPLEDPFDGDALVIGAGPDYSSSARLIDGDRAAAVPAISQEEKVDAVLE